MTLNDFEGSKGYSFRKTILRSPPETFE